MNFKTLLKSVFAFGLLVTFSNGATVTLQMSSGLTNAVNFANFAGTAQSGLVWGVIVDTGADGINYANLAGLQLSTSTSGIQLGTSNDYLFVSSNLTTTLPVNVVFGAESGATGQISDISDIITQVPATNPVSVGQSFTLVWFDSGTTQTTTLVAGQHYGTLSNALFIIPAGGATQDYSSVFSANPDPIRSASLTIVPEPTFALLGALGGLVLLRRRR